MAHRHDKGLFELHRFASDRDAASTRAIADRYQGGNDFKILLFNAGLFRAAGFATQYADINQRKREIGRMLREKEYDIVGLNEVWFYQQINTLLDNAGDVVWAGSPPGNDNDAPDNNGLLTVIFDNGPGPTPSHINDTFGFYSRHESAGLDKIVRKGWQYTEIDLGKSGNLDFFVTHLNHAQDDEKYRKARLSQIDTLIEGISQHAKQGNVTIVVGDFNVLGNRAEYDEMVRRMDRRLGLEDVWLTRGGEIAKTSWFAEADWWFEDGGDHDWPWDCRNYLEDCACDPYVDRLRGHDDGSVRVDRNARLDYVFVESPKMSHDLTLDIRRVRRKTFPRYDPRDQPGAAAGDDIVRATYDCATRMADCPSGSTHCYTEPYLSDHMGIELEILASEA